MCRIKQLVTVCLLATFTAFCLGCGNGGGASTEPTITVKPAESTGDNGGGTNGPDNGEATTVEGFGTLTGVITYDGDFTPLDPIHSKGAPVKDAEVCSAEPMPNESLVVDSESKGIANVFIYMDRAPKGVEVPPPPEDPVIFDQKNCRFIPHALIVRVGQTVQVLSNDPAAHNTHTKPKANPESNFLLPPNDRTGQPVVYKKAEREPFQVVCDIHNWMIAYQMTLDHPYMALTAADGTFEIKDVPAGTHTFRVWHEKGGFLQRNQKVEIKPDETSELKLSFGGDKFAKADGPATKRVVLSLSK